MRKHTFATAASLAAATTAATVMVLTLPSGGASTDTTVVDLTVGGLPAGGLDRSRLMVLLNDAAAKQPARVVVRLGVRELKLESRELGLALDVAATADRALAASDPSHRRRGSGGDAATRDVVPVVSIDRPTFDQAISLLIARADLAAQDGDLVYQNGVLRPVPPAAGQRANRPEISAALTEMARRLPWPSTVDAPVHARTPDTTPADLQAPLRRGRELLTRPLVLRAGTRRAFVKPTALGPALTVITHHSPSGHRLELGLRAVAGAELAASLARRLSVAATEPRLSAPAATAELRDQGTVVWRPHRAAIRLRAPGNAGQAVEPQAVLQELRGLLPGESGSNATLPTRPAPPRVTDEQARSIDAVLGTFTTAFQCCQPRVRNISLIARTVDGTLIGPGQTFSLNTVVGPRTRAKGYVEAPFILNGELSTDVGGGVSQFATTALNAAYFAGLRIDGHRPHSFYISRYPAGREATVNYPSIDLRWTNTTAAPVLVRATALSTSLTVTIYGRDDGRSVSSVTGPRTAVPGKDFRITVTRVITVPGRPTARRTWTTTYNKPPPSE